MIHGCIENANCIMRGNGAEIYDVHCIVQREGDWRAVTTAWFPTPDELRRLNEGAPVYVTQLVEPGMGMQPMRVEVKP